MVSAKPACPEQEDGDGTGHTVKNVSGSGPGRRRYHCTCGHTWTQTQPEYLGDEDDPCIVPASESRAYRCGTCGEPKVGHTCAGRPSVRSKMPRRSASASSSAAARAVRMRVAPAPMGNVDNTEEEEAPVVAPAQEEAAAPMEEEEEAVEEATEAVSNPSPPRAPRAPIAPPALIAPPAPIAPIAPTDPTAPTRAGMLRSRAIGEDASTITATSVCPLTDFAEYNGDDRDEYGERGSSGSAEHIVSAEVIAPAAGRDSRSIDAADAADAADDAPQNAGLSAHRVDAAQDPRVGMRIMCATAGTGVSALEQVPSSSYLAFLQRHDMRPSEAVALHSAISSEMPTHPERVRDEPTAAATSIRCVRGDANVRQATSAYFRRLGDVRQHELKDAHRKLLQYPPSGLFALELLVSDGDADPVPRAILLMERPKRRGRIDLVHTHPEYRSRGYAHCLAEAAKSHAPDGGTLTVDSPWCTARSAVHVWLRAGFMCSRDLLTSTLRDDATYSRDNNRSVRLTFSWSQRETTEGVRIRQCFLRDAARVHPELARYCSSPL